MNFSLRISTRTRENEVLDFQDPVPTKKKTLFKFKTDVKEHRQEEDSQAKSKGNQQLQPQEGEPQQEEHHLVTSAKSKEHQQLQEEPQEEIDHHFVTLPLGVGVIPIDICFSEETKPTADPLSLLQPVSKTNYHVKVPQESLEKVLDVAVVFKSALVSHLEKLAHSLDIAEMVRSANECFERMRALEVDYQTFHGQISRLIEYYQKLKEATEAKNLELEAAYEMSVIEADDAKTKLHRAKNDLLSAQTTNNLTRERIKVLKKSLGQLKAQDGMERIKIATLTAERDHCHEAHSSSLRKVDRLYSERETKIKRDDATREEIQRLLSRLKGPEEELHFFVSKLQLSFSIANARPAHLDISMCDI